MTTQNRQKSNAKKKQKKQPHPDHEKLVNTEATDADL